jgi:hypothetical protein
MTTQNPFRQRRPNGDGGWIWKLGEKRVLYRLRELLKYADGTVFVCEGEKDADRLAEMDFCATTIASGKWTDDCVQPLVGRDVLIMQDNDEPGARKAQHAASLLYGIAASVRVVLLPGLPPGGDVSDWFEQDSRRTKDQFIDFCFDQPLFSPDDRAAITEQPAREETPETPEAPPAPAKQLKPTVKEPEILRYRSHRDANDPAPKYLVKNLLPEVGIGLLSGQWGTYKTFIAIKLAGAIGTGQPFAGYATKRRGAVLYLAREGAGELPLRLEALNGRAWRQRSADLLL